MFTAAGIQTTSVQKSSASTSAVDSAVTADGGNKPASTAVINTSLLKQPAQTQMSERDQLDVS